MKFFDFNFLLPVWPHVTASSLVLEAVDESWPNRLFSARELFPDLPISDLRRSLRGQSLRQRFSCWDQFLCLAFAQLTYRESLRDIEACLRAQHAKLYHMGFRGRVSRNTLAYANEHRDWRIYADFAQGLIRTARDLYRDEPLGSGVGRDGLRLRFHHHRFVLGSFFPGRNFAATKVPCKLHTLLDLRGRIPTNVYVTGGQVQRRQASRPTASRSRRLLLARPRLHGLRALYILTQACAFFVTRARSDAQFYRRLLAPVDRSTGLRSDQTILLDRSPHSRAIPIPCAASTTSTPRRTCD